jgi:hypothetical protein
MFIKLTNASPAHKGKKLLIRKDLIVTVHRSIAIREDETIDEASFVFAPPHGTWEVEEELDEIESLLNK